MHYWIATGIQRSWQYYRKQHRLVKVQNGECMLWRESFPRWKTYIRTNRGVREGSQLSFCASVQFSCSFSRHQSDFIYIHAAAEQRSKLLSPKLWVALELVSTAEKQFIGDILQCVLYSSRLILRRALFWGLPRKRDYSCRQPFTIRMHYTPFNIQLPATTASFLCPFTESWCSTSVGVWREKHVRDRPHGHETQPDRSLYRGFSRTHRHDFYSPVLFQANAESVRDNHSLLLYSL